ncbi:hypothetical protein ACX5K5_16215 [Glutamicibacter bergerei]|jgi:hypothetical protein|uniref:Uncharacterized protein n=2 Tax=Glutamicibacter TaxID=1742989 RepID=A0ABV9MPH6_9MICC|nr:hypothetical protein [Glutamicibacter ardleyensis]GGJ51550.1 hypothetical protein GCM10007173_07630 [Glutamicibacter ardleyensis]HBV10760.1 hypothetical protein [Micrococcaceae bacterium]
MTANQPASINYSPKEARVLSATTALQTGMFQPIENLDPDMSPRPRINPSAPTFFDRLLRR